MSIVLLRPAAFAQEGPTGLTIDDLRALATARRAKLGALQIGYTAYHEPPPGSEFSSRYIPSISRTVLVDVQTGRYSMERIIELDTGEEPEPVEFAFDGEIQTTLLPVAMLGFVDDHPLLNGHMEARVLGLMMANPPDPNGLGIADASLESLLQHGILLEGTDDVGGRPCYVIEAWFEGTHYATIWLDVERDLLPLKRVVFGWDGSEASRVVVDGAVAFQETWSGEKLWVPTRWEQELQIRGQVFRSSFEADAESIVVNPQVEESDFRIEFPPGTRVTDRIAGVTYTVSESGDPVDVVFQEDLDVPADPKADLGLLRQERDLEGYDEHLKARDAPPTAKSQVAAPLGDDQSGSVSAQAPGSPSEPGTQAVREAQESLGSPASQTVSSLRQDPKTSKRRGVNQRLPGQNIAVTSADGSVVLERRSVAGLTIWLIPLLIVVALALLAAYHYRSAWRSR